MCLQTSFTCEWAFTVENSRSQKGYSSRALCLELQGFGTPPLHSKLHLARISVSFRAPSGERIWALGFRANILGLQALKTPF